MYLHKNHGNNLSFTIVKKYMTDVVKWNTFPICDNFINLQPLFQSIFIKKLISEFTVNYHNFRNVGTQIFYTIMLWCLEKYTRTGLV